MSPAQPSLPGLEPLTEPPPLVHLVTLSIPLGAPPVVGVTEGGHFEHLWSPDEVMTFLGITPRQLAAEVHARRLRRCATTRRLCFPVSEVSRYLTERAHRCA